LAASVPVTLMPLTLTVLLVATDLVAKLALV
jgi:hypothetical protein